MPKDMQIKYKALSWGSAGSPHLPWYDSGLKYLPYTLQAVRFSPRCVTKPPLCKADSYCQPPHLGHVSMSTTPRCISPAVCWQTPPIRGGV